MREIKFRGKRLDNGEWVVGDLIENQGRFFIYHATSETTIEDDDDGRISIVAVEVDPATVGQYTGLKDRNNLEIYEGDVVELVEKSVCIRTVGYQRSDCHCFGKRLIVRWFPSGFMLSDQMRFKEPNASGNVRQYDFWNNTPFLCMVGNIHDNPELMKGGEQ